VSDTQPLVEVSDVYKHFPLTRGVLFQKQVGAVHAVDGVSFDIKEGETFGLVGESGCGKSTLARVITRLHEPTAGSVRFAGQDIAGLGSRELKPLRRDLQMIFQDPYSSLNPRKTVGSIIAEPFAIHGLLTGAGERKRAVQELMEQVGLNPEHYNRFPHEFSGGQRQRIAIARAIVTNPRILILDDATASVDATTEAKIRLGLREAMKGRTTLIIAHRLSTISLADEIVVLDHGRVVARGTQAELAETSPVYREIREHGMIEQEFVARLEATA
jgi:ABC-type oligopeptide transport system ATPase subunit